MLPDRVERRHSRSPGRRGLPGGSEVTRRLSLNSPEPLFSASSSFGARHWGTVSAEGSDGSRTAGDAQQLIARAELLLLSVARA